MFTSEISSKFLNKILIIKKQYLMLFSFKLLNILVFSIIGQHLNVLLRLC